MMYVTYRYNGKKIFVHNKRPFYLNTLDKALK